MLKRLTIVNYALIDALEITFPGHLAIITGETGAGKSILLGALSLLMGAKADASVLKKNSANCVLEAEFENPDTIVRRVISPQGRSRFFVDDEPSTADAVRSMAARLVDIHSQNSQLKLAEEEFQLSVVDAFAGNGNLLTDYKSVYDELAAADSQLRQLEKSIAEREKERDYLEFQLQKLEDAALVEGELPALEEEQSSLANAEEIKSGLLQSLSSLSGEDSSAISAVKEAENALGRIGRYLGSVEELGRRLESCRIELKDIEGEIASLEERLSVSPERLEKVEERLALLYDLMRRFGKGSVEELIAMRDELSGKLVETGDLELQRVALKKRIEQLDGKCASLAEELHRSRSEKAPALAEAISASAASLEMPYAKFDVEVSDSGCRGEKGKDSVRFLFSANAGKLCELSKCASGGEISRVMLCIKALLAKLQKMPTLIFDEIDTGVSGSVADKMGAMIVEMGRSMQVMAITHLPQVASKGDSHFLVYKEVDPEKGAETHIKEICAEERVREIARMLSGAELTPEAISNARVLLGHNANNLK